ncbi:hypothetical protein AVEN_141955-1 [Araneus ventricosus]|uniref:Mos1 transposase HTH domain-containing protein n=1 Tax=Araneus ventricosus TaxID=182803 RepID=A0A4Y2MBG3_ARAVE|nr:hypothetical protein AVEN_141955-1 [Araneus ventricosus]
MDSSRSAQRVGIQFLQAEGEHASQIYRKMKEVYGEKCLERCTMFRWCQRYEAGRNRRITTRKIAAELSISKGTMLHIIHKKLGYASLGTVGAQASVRESEDGEMGTGSIKNPGVCTLKPSTPFL